MGRDKNIGAGRGGAGRGGAGPLVVTMSTSTSKQIPHQKVSKNATSAVNNTVNKLILYRRSCEKLRKKLRLADPVFIASGISEMLFCF